MSIYDRIAIGLRNTLSAFVFQSTGCLVHVVPESAEIDPVHRLAQLQVGDPEGYHHSGRCHYDTAVLLRDTRIHRQAHAGRVISVLFDIRFLNVHTRFV